MDSPQLHRPMTSAPLTLRELNRATLARQALLAREDVAAEDAVARLFAMQGQVSQAPFVGLWTRLAGFRREDLHGLLTGREVVKATTLRATLHFVTAADYLAYRGTLQPMLTKGWEAIAKQRGGPIEPAEYLERTRDWLAEEPRSFAEISEKLSAEMPEYDVGMLRYGVRLLLPLVQVPTEAAWGYPANPRFTLAESWLGSRPEPEDQIAGLIRRYLAAFGPATVTDAQTWSGLVQLRPSFEALRGELVSFRDERKRELFDLADAPRPAADTPAPVRFLPEFDNLLIGHDKRDRIVADEHKKRVYLPGLRVAPTFLVDGFVAGTWRIDEKKGRATLSLQPFAALDKASAQALGEEAEGLVRFAEPGATDCEVRLLDPEGG